MQGLGACLVASLIPCTKSRLSSGTFWSGNTFLLLPEYWVSLGLGNEGGTVILQRLNKLGFGGESLHCVHCVCTACYF